MRFDAGISIARRVGLPLFERFNPGDITIRNHHTGHRVRLHSFRHKGYWFHGKRREATTIQVIKDLLRPGDVVVEVGGHIGYFSQLFADLVGPTGHVTVFEPGPNNLPYLHRNVDLLENVDIIESGVGDHEGVSDFFIESLTGQNNSFVADFAGLDQNARSAGITPDVETVRVQVTTLDSAPRHAGQAIDFVKVDVEGFELSVLKGAANTLATDRPVWMVEIQAHHDLISSLAAAAGYRVYSEDLLPFDWDAPESGNSFWFHEELHASMIETLDDRRHQS